MFYLSNRKLRLFIITLLLLIFCFIFGIFNVNALSYSADISGSLPDGGGLMNGSVTINTNFNSTLFNGYRNGFVIYTFQIGGNFELYRFEMFGSEGQSTECNIGVNSTYSDNTTQRTTYSATCYIDLISGGLSGFRTIGYSNGTTFFNYGRKMTYVVNEDTNVVNAIRDLQNALVNQNNFDSQIKNNTDYIKNNSEDIKNNTNDIKDALTNDSIDNNSASSSASSWNSKNATNGTITSLLTLPITLLQAIVNGLQTSCSSFSLGSLFGTNISLPCIDIGNLIGNGLWTTIDFLFSGFMILAISKKLIKIFNDFTNLKSNQIDELYGGGK